MATVASAKKNIQTVSIDRFKDGLRDFGEQDFLAIDRILQYLQANPVDAESIQSYLYWNAQHYTRNLIEKNEYFELLAICWEPGMCSSIHNHKGQNCWMAAPMGKLAVQNYQVLAEDLSAHRCNIVATDTVEITPTNPVAVDPVNPVHDVRNPREWAQRAVSLHVYSRPFDSCVVYSVEQGSCGEIGLNYTSMYGKRC